MLHASQAVYIPILYRPLISSTLLRPTESEAYFDGITTSIDRSHSSILSRPIPLLDPPRTVSPYVAQVVALWEPSFQLDLCYAARKRL